jgi:hypothetical protein
VFNDNVLAVERNSCLPGQRGDEVAKIESASGWILPDKGPAANITLCILSFFASFKICDCFAIDAFPGAEGESRYASGNPLYSKRYDFDSNVMPNGMISTDDLFYIAQDWLTSGGEY